MSFRVIYLNENAVLQRQVPGKKTAGLTAIWVRWFRLFDHPFNLPYPDIHE